MTQPSLVPGIYERLLDEELASLLHTNPDLIASLEKLDDECTVQAYSQLVAQLLREALPNTDSHLRMGLINRLIELIGAQDGLDYTLRKRLLAAPKTLLREVRVSNQLQPHPQPETPLAISSLLTGATDDPPLEHELKSEMLTANRVDILVSFIKWSGLSLLISTFEKLEVARVPVRIITTSYMGASDPVAVEWLAKRCNVTIKVSYDTERTRLHAKAYHFHRESGYSTAYIGSANMSRPAITSGLEWTVKATAQDMPHILDRFAAEFETYWLQESFVPFDMSQSERFRSAIESVRTPQLNDGARFFVDLRPHPFQERVLEALTAAREADSHRNLVVAATGTGKTVMAAFDYARFRRAFPDSSRLLFVAHRKEILLQSRDCFRMVLRDFNFGETFVDGLRPETWESVFASVQSLAATPPWSHLDPGHFDFVIVDEAHHGTASSYRPLFDHLRPKILLGLSATPERMDGSSILPDFDNRFAAEIRLPEALVEKLLCPFHYFGVTDPVATADERFWRNGKYDTTELENVYTGDDVKAISRLNAILTALERYFPDTQSIRGIGFCAGVRHAEFMARKFQDQGLTAEVVLGTTPGPDRTERVARFRQGQIHFLFTVDVFSEGIDIPEINLVLFLRPTESLTVFLQQLGRGLRHAPGKECLTVLDFVGQTHRHYRVDRKFAALLRSSRRRIDKEIENDFPSLPPGCSVELERVAREHVLDSIRRTLGDLKHFVPEAIKTFSADTNLPLTFANFITETGLSPIELLQNRTWSEWKDLADGTAKVKDPDIREARAALKRFALRSDNRFLNKVERLTSSQLAEDPANYGMSNEEAASLHYLFWTQSGQNMNLSSYRDSFARWLRNESSSQDLKEVIEWRKSIRPFPTFPTELPYPCYLQIHGAYGLREITAAFGKANLQTSGPAGSGMIPIKSLRTYLHLVTFKKEDRDFSPTTRYKDYPIAPTILHWESQSSTTQKSTVGQNYIHFRERGYTILFFARTHKETRGETSPFLFLGSAKALLSYEGDRPIRMTWELEHALPAELYQAARAV